MTEGLHIANSLATRAVCNLRDDAKVPVRQTANMESADKPLHHLRDWRNFRGLSQEDLAEQIGTTKSVISLLETGERQLSPKWLFRLAPVLKTKPGAIIDHNPYDLPRDVIDIWLEIAEDQRPQAMKVLETFRKAASDR
ncbi:helix-turn-helix transcriptional regulator [Caulobacter sp. SL161]|uniref:helix-turn-helix domain-containing protein n=1 Tax=Caulobacter sp. SL161 TaxID=2995156 RepID=UPI0022751248|nr:helix-turn-helix transcriptional regulator [Caulobacter sp. SL161]MCY1649101.1 helix-turn-helix transcriptional regulator [Caulobacter sp. SL161]